MSVAWNDKKWVAFGDSLTDPTAAAGEQKYHYWINSYTGITRYVYGKGSTGYWQYTNNDPATRFYARMMAASADPGVEVVTIFGSVNDWKYWGGSTSQEEIRYAVPAMGFDKSGNQYTFAQHFREYGRYSWLTNQQAADVLSFTDTVANTESTTYGVSWVAYVNECINIAHEKFPNAKVILVDEIYFDGVRFDQMTSCLRVVKEELVKSRRENGDTWLSLVKLEQSRYSGIEDPDRKYLNTMAGYGLSFYQLADATFKGYYTTDNKGHPTVLYNRIWLAPVFANMLAVALCDNPNELPPTLRMSEEEQESLYALWVGKPDTPIPPSPTVHTATFKADGIVVDTVDFETGATVLPRVPAVPAKVGYTGAWERYTLADADITINAVYTANTYRVTFVADGVTVAVVPYQYGAQSITEPAVPPKEGYTGTWSPYTLGPQDSVSTAVYTPIEWEPTGYALGPDGPVMVGLRPDGTEAYEGLTPAGAVAFRRYAD